MSAQFRGKGRKGTIYVGGTVGWKQRSCGTADRHVVRAMQRMVSDLRDRRRFELLDAVIDRRLTLGELYDAYVANDLPALTGRLAAIDLAPLVDEWIAQYLADGRSESNAPIYRSAVVSLIGDATEGDRFLSSDLTPARVMMWIRGMTGVTSGTKRGKLMALRSFVRYCVTVGALRENPIRDVAAPKKNPPSMRWEPQAVDEAIVAAAPDARYAALFAFIHATGADLSPVLHLTTRRDIDLERGVATLRGTKTAKRQVHEAIIEPWALPALRAHLRGMLPHVKPWADITRYMAHWWHTKAATAAKAEGYTLRQARHSVAVRARQAGRSFEWIASQLGNSVYQVATVYARFEPDTDERLAALTATNRATRRNSRHKTDEARNA